MTNRSKCFKNNSLCARGQISVVSELDAAAPKPAVGVVELGMALRRLVPGRNRISLACIKTDRRVITLYLLGLEWRMKQKRNEEQSQNPPYTNSVLPMER